MERLCRICLNDGANILIFGSQDVDSVYTKLSQCVREKVEDLEGYPRKICTVCYSTLESVCAFIKKYKESYKILESGLVPVKEEPLEDTCNEQSDIEVDLCAVKSETDLNNTTMVLGEPLKLKIDKLKNISVKRLNPSKTSEEEEKSNDVFTGLLNGKVGSSGKVKDSSTKLSLKDLKQRTKKLKLLKRKKELEEKRKNKSKKTVKKVPQPVKKELEAVKKPSDEPKPPKLCDVCGDVFPTSDQLSSHKKKKHADVPVECPTCKRMCSSKYYLNRHIKRKHSDEKDFICQVCGTGFAFKGELTSHYNHVHVKRTGPPRTWSCKICGKTYKCPKSVVVHERSVHTGERPAVCTICNTSFTHHDYLKEHMRLHTGETPFKCPICGRGYAQRCNMKSHLRIHKVSELDAVTLSKLRPNYLRRLKA